MNIISEFQSICSSNQPVDVKTNLMNDALIRNSPVFAMLAGGENAAAAAAALTNLGRDFQLLASQETNPQLQERMNIVANRLFLAAREAQTPRTEQNWIDDTNYTPEDLRRHQQTRKFDKG